MLRRFTLLVVGVLLLVACGGSASPTATQAPAATPTPEATPTQATATPLAELSWEEVVDKLTPSTVMIRADFPETAVSWEGAGAGTGIVYSKDGYIITNAHVVDGAAALTVFTPDSNKERSARFVGISTCDDLAVIQVDDMEGLEPATFGESADLKVGQDVAVLGYPLSFDLGRDLSMARGIVSKVNQTLPPYESLIQTDAAINHGNSGGPMVNRQGEVVGINTLTIDPMFATNINFAISIDQARPVLEDLLQGKNRLWLGMNLGINEYADYFGTDQGLVVEAVASGGPASKANVQPAYLLTKLEGLTVNSMADVCKITRSHSEGDALKVEFLNVTDSGYQWLEGEIILGEATVGTPLRVVASESFAVAAGGGDGEVQTAVWDFTTDTGEWPTGAIEEATIAVMDGAYVFDLKSPESYWVVSPAGVEPGPQQLITADVFLSGGTAGLVSRYTINSANEWSFYLCYITYDGQYGCDVSVDDQFIPLVDPTPSSAITPGAVNELELMAVDNEITFTINGIDVAVLTDNTLGGGQAGLYFDGWGDSLGSGAIDNVTINWLP